jgi:hypothetical protein
MIGYTLAAQTLSAAAGIRAAAILQVLLFIAFHSLLSLLFENNPIDIILERIIAEFGTRAKWRPPSWPA